MAPRVFYIVAENEEIEHIADEMHPPSVHEHRGKNREPVRQRDVWRKIGMARVFHGHHRPFLKKGLQLCIAALTEFYKKYQDVDCDDQIVNKGSGSPVGIIVSEWNHF